MPLPSVGEAGLAQAKPGEGAVSTADVPSAYRLSPCERGPRLIPAKAGTQSASPLAGEAGGGEADAG